MLYSIFKWLFYPTLKAYFNSIHLHNTRAIPDKGPVIFAVNHTSAFMDPILIAVFNKRTLHFLARGEAFKSKFAKAFYRRLNMLPIYRPETTPDEVYKNKFAFRACEDHLSKGKTIIIFPEGFSKTERRLRPIKTGIARIAFGAEAKNDFQLGVKIIPIGINYSDPHRFKTDVFVNYGDPIEVKDFEADFRKNEKQAYQKLTDLVRISLEEQTVVIENEKHDLFVKGLEDMYRTEFGYNINMEQQALDNFELSKRIVRSVDELEKEDLGKYNDLSRRVSTYFSALKRMRIEDHQIERGHILLNLIRDSLFMLFGLPFFLVGYLLNIIPFYFAGMISGKIQVREDFVGSLKITAGMFMFLIYYIVQALIIKQFYGGMIALISLLLFYPLGLFAIRYAKRFFALRDSFKFDGIIRRKFRLLDKLKMERKAILEAIQLT